MLEKDSQNFNIINNLKNKLFEKTEITFLDLKFEFRPRLILSSILNKKSIILKNLPKMKKIVLEKLSNLFQDNKYLYLSEDIACTFTSI